MPTITDQINIDCLPEEVYNTLVFFFRSSRNYRRWHFDHISCSWVSGKDFSPGSVLVAEEYLHGKPHKLGFKITKKIYGSYLRYRMLLPWSLVCSGGSFRMTAGRTGTDLVTTLCFRGGLITQSVFRKQLQSIKKHMMEESQNIKKFIEDSDKIF